MVYILVRSRVWAELSWEWVVQVETGRWSGGLGYVAKDDVK